MFHSHLKYGFWREDVVLNWRMTMPGELGSKWSYPVLKCYPTIFTEGLMRTKNELKDSHLHSKNWTWDLLSMKQEFLHLPVMFVSTVVWWTNVPVCHFLWNVGWKSALLWVITHQVVVISYYSLQNNPVERNSQLRLSRSLTLCIGWLILIFFKDQRMTILISGN